MCVLCDFLKGLFPEVCAWDPTVGLPPSRTGNLDAIGIVIQPGPHYIDEYIQLFMTNPEEVANLWGHTALYVRRGGQIVRVIGFDPHRIMMVRDVLPRLLGGWGGRVSGGRRGTTGVYYDEERMFRSPDFIAVEFPLGVGQLYHIDEILGLLPQTGTTSALTHRVTTSARSRPPRPTSCGPARSSPCTTSTRPRPTTSWRTSPATCPRRWRSAGASAPAS